MKKRSKEGSITIFSALSLMLVASLLLALLESARVYGLDARAELLTELGVESVCGEYQIKLWKDYGLLCLDGAYGGVDFQTERVADRFVEQVSKNCKGTQRGANFFTLSASDAEVASWELLTDGNGSVFFALVSSYMKQNLPKEAAKAILERYESGQKLEEEKDSYSVETAKDTLEEAKEAAKEETEGAGKADTGSVPEKENPLEIVLKLKQNAILGMVVENVDTLSERKLNIEETVSRRTLNRGTMPEMPEKDWYERILVLEYAGQYFSDYTRPLDGHKVSYEMEYLLCGKAEDRANLEGTVIRLLALRETANIVHILSDSSKRKSASLMAEALAGFTGNAAVIQVVQAGVIAAWAYMESVQDVRALLAGDKIALIKSANQWTVDTENLLESFQKTAKAKNCSNGWNYSEYLKFLLYTKSQKVLAMRMMDVMEQNLRQIERYQNCRMDYMITALEIQTEYRAVPLFSKLVAIGKLKTKNYYFKKSTKFSYIL